MANLVHKHNGLQSFSSVYDPTENRPIEYFFSILKQEYLMIHKPKTMEEVQALIPKIIFHYNHIRIQKNLDYKTPAGAGV